MGRGGTALGIIGIIIAAGAVGFSFVVLNGQNITNSDMGDLIDELNNLTDELNNLTDELNNLTRTNIVGIWDALADSQAIPPHNALDDWLLEFGDNSLSNPNYIFVSNSSTRITLLKPGWYRIHLTVLLVSMNPSNLYFTVLLKDGVDEFVFDTYETSLAMNSGYHSIDSSAFVYSNGTNYIEIRGTSAFGDDFNVPISNELYNQLTIEFVAL
ncbi:hypothetical protein LCGC14_0918070 [marine sediment metagenome]|uniref:TNF family profile domain-containing protein n=1 Tax=marine sediment metagenome TaxID=412755 RepID=A0A0F9NRR6_9ZZZZ|nr:hypothetical protein [archaeon]